MSYVMALTEDWDLNVGSDGGIRMLRGKDAILQEVANRCRCFRRDLFYYQSTGIDWASDQLGKKPAVSVVSARLREAALAVEGVSKVKSVTIEEMDKQTRTLRGKIEIETKDGEDGISVF